MCKRSDNDPLVRILTDRYKLNILRLPRAGVGVGELLIKEGKDLKCSGCIKKFFDPELDIQEDGPMSLPDLGGVTFAHLSAMGAAEPLAVLLSALGVVGVSSISAALRSTRDVSVVFSLTGAKYRSTDLVALGDELSGRVLRQNNALYKPGREFFVAHAAGEATGINVTFSGSREKAAKLALDVEEIIKTEADVEVAKGERGYLVFSSTEPVTFGLAVVQVVLDGDSLRFEATDRLRAVRGEESKRGAPASGVPNILFGGFDGPIFVDIG